MILSSLFVYFNLCLMPVVRCFAKVEATRDVWGESYYPNGDDGSNLNPGSERNLKKKESALSDDISDLTRENAGPDQPVGDFKYQ